MKKSLTIVLLAVILAFLGFAFTSQDKIKVVENKGIQFFEGIWQEAIKKAEAENKLIFLDAYAAWCGPCKILAKRYFTQEHVGQFYNEHFINYKMDMEKSPEGPRLSRKWRLRAYPTLYFINPDETIVRTSVGLIDDKALLEIGKAVNNSSE